MRLVLTGRHVDITPGIRRLVDRKLTRLERLLGNALVSSQVVLTLEKGRHLADVMVHVSGDHMLSTRTDGPTWSAAMTAALEKIQHQAAKVKGKWAERKRRRSPPPPEAEASAPLAREAARNGPHVVRVSRAQFKPMSVENAAIELAASGDPFLLFRNVDTDGLSVLIRRSSGAFGLVEPDR
jgi:ribosome hibernation promoting factor